MLASNGLAVSVSDTGILIHFIAHDGSETQIDVLTVLDASSAMTNKALVNWCHERLDGATADEVSEERRFGILATIDEVAAAKEAELGTAEAAGANLEISNAPGAAPEEWLERAEQALDVSAVLLTKEAFKALLMLAKKGAGIHASPLEAPTNLADRAWDCCS